MTRHTLALTTMEWSALAECIRVCQEMHAETFDDRLDPTLSRIQRKMGDVPSG